VQQPRNHQRRNRTPLAFTVIPAPTRQNVLSLHFTGPYLSSFNKEGGSGPHKGSTPLVVWNHLSFANGSSRRRLAASSESKQKMVFDHRRGPCLPCDSTQLCEVNNQTPCECDKEDICAQVTLLLPDREYGPTDQHLPTLRLR